MSEQMETQSMLFGKGLGKKKKKTTQLQKKKKKQNKTPNFKKIQNTDFLNC